ncbi:MAG: PDZ domain-containing protein [Desulfobacteraceae bacterium]|nr:PDZ domain-containing protein [Desulfobacteraceae bacterium]
MTRLYSTIFNLFALSAVIYLGVDIFYKILSSHLAQVETRITVVQKAPPVQIQKRPPLSDFRVITGRNIFGASEKPPKGPKVKELGADEIEALAPTSLNVSLLGTVTGNKEIAFAVIEEKQKRKQGLYKRGDTVQNATIKKILRGKVVLRVGDRDEILTMEEAASGKIRRGGGSEGPVTTGATITLAKSDLEKSLKNLGQLLTQVRVRPRIKDGKPDGLQLARIKSGSIFSKLGLKNGDVVQKINGSPIKSPDDVFSLYQRLKSGSHVSVDIIRKGETKTITYSFR